MSGSHPSLEIAESQTTKAAWQGQPWGSHLRHWEQIGLFEDNRPECSCKIVARAGCEEQLILLTIRWGSTAKLYSPELIDVDLFAIGVFDRTHKLAGDAVESVDRSLVVNIVGNQQSIT